MVSLLKVKIAKSVHRDAREDPMFFKQGPSILQHRDIGNFVFF